MRIHPLYFSSALFAVLFTLSACSDAPKQPAVDAAEQAPAADASVPTTAPMEATPPAETPVVAPVTVSPYEGKIVRQPPSTGGKEDGWFFVKDGKRRWISDAAWLEKNGFQATDVIEISAEELQSIPEDMEAITP